MPKAAKNTGSIAIKPIRMRADAGLNASDLDWTRTKLTPPPPPNKVKFAMRLDADLLTWFRAQGKGYQTKINSILRTYYEQMRKTR